MKKSHNFCITTYTLKPYGVNSCNRDDLNKSKNVILGGVDRVRFSSQSIKSVMRNFLASENIRTNYVFNELAKRVAKNLGQTVDAKLVKLIKDMDILKLESSKDSDEAIAQNIINNIGIKGKTTEVTDDRELNEIAATIADGIRNGEKPKEITAKFKEAVSTVDLWTAMFGRMTTSSAFYTVYSAVNTSHGYSIDENFHQDDFIATMDTFNEKYSDKPGASNLQNESFSSNIMYTVFNVEINMILHNYPRPEGKSIENYAKEVAEYVKAVIWAFVYLSPSGKQNSCFSNPTPIAISTVKSRDVDAAWSMDSAYVNAIEANEKTVAEQGVDKMEDWLENELPLGEYQIAMWSKYKSDKELSFERYTKMNSFGLWLEGLEQEICEYIIANS